MIYKTIFIKFIMKFIIFSILFCLNASLFQSSKINSRSLQSKNNNTFKLPNSKLQGDTIYGKNIKYEFKDPIQYVNLTQNLNLYNTNITYENNSTIGFKNISMLISNFTGGKNETFYFNGLNITNSTFIVGNDSVISGNDVFIWNSNVVYGKTFNKTLWRGKWTVLNSTVNGVRFRNGSANYTAFYEYLNKSDKIGSYSSKNEN